MKKESKICDTCRIRTMCHKALRPEIMHDDGTTRRIPDHYTHIEDLDCRHVSCDSEGIPAARKAKRSGIFKLFPVSVGSDRTDQFRAAVFGSADKPTHKGEWRIVSDIGQIFSKQDNVFYPTGQWV